MKALVLLICLPTFLLSQTREEDLGKLFSRVKIDQLTSGSKYVIYEESSQMSLEAPLSISVKKYIGQEATFIKSQKKGQILVFELQDKTKMKYFPHYMDDFVKGFIDVQKLKLINDSIQGLKMYVLSKYWYYPDRSIEQITRKFFLATFEGVEITNDSDGYRLKFRDFMNRSCYARIHFGDEGKIMTSFSEMFSFTNPRNKYSNISPEVWNIITQENVRIGMTKEECELSWGTPKDINHTTSSNISSEQWVYSPGNYLYFENGILVTIQN